VSKDEQVSEFIGELRRHTQLSLKLLDEAYQVLVAPSEGPPEEARSAPEVKRGKNAEERRPKVLPTKPTSG